MKNLLGLIAAAAMTISTGVMAAAIPGTAITGGDTGTCKVLGENVRINLSKGVKGSYECFEVTNSINVGACHESGSRSNQLTCAQVGMSTANPPVPVYNNAACTAANVGTTITIATTSYRGFRAATTGGSVGAQSLSTNCSATTAEELIK